MWIEEVDKREDVLAVGEGGMEAYISRI